MQWRRNVKAALHRDLQVLTVKSTAEKTLEEVLADQLAEEKEEKKDEDAERAAAELAAFTEAKRSKLEAKKKAEFLRKAALRREKDHPILVSPEWNYMFALDAPCKAFDMRGTLASIDVNCRRTFADRIRGTVGRFLTNGPAEQAASNFRESSAPYPSALAPFVSRDEYSGMLADLRCIFLSGLSYSAARNYLAFVVTRRLMHTRGVAVFLYQVRVCALPPSQPRPSRARPSPACIPSHLTLPHTV